MKTKTCSKCKTEKTIDNFHNRSISADGLNASCKICTNANIRARAKLPAHKATRDAYLEANKEQRQDYQAKYYTNVNKQRRADKRS